MWLAIVVLTLAAALIIAFVLVALKGSDSDMDLDFDLDGLLDKITGSAGDAATFTGDVALPLLDSAAVYAGGIIDEASSSPRFAEPAEPMGSGVGPVCTACGRPLTPGLTRCPACGAPVGGA
jgi:hypothetical protein